MWHANLADGKSISSKNMYWTDIKPEMVVKSVQLSHPRIPNLNLCLSGYDRYYFSKEAVQLLEVGKTNVVAEVIGAHDLKLGIGVEIRLDYTGTVKVRSYPVSDFKWAPDILREGKAPSTES
jgi:hypothetical protein